ncbi:MAG: hypothetical protein EOM52_11380 [Clostridia bacterium]|nr:hypothetical protein [Clostridia bacterium]
MDLAQIGDFGLLRQKEAVTELMSVNRFTAAYGLVFTEEQALVLSQARESALRHTARLEFGAGILPKLVLAFRDSPELPGEDPVALLSELTDIFYEFKNETLDALTDDELLAAMKAAFDGPCHGSTELLAARDLSALAGFLRNGPAAGGAEEEEDGDVWN